MSERTIWIGLGLTWLAATSCGGDAAATTGPVEGYASRAGEDHHQDAVLAQGALEKAKAKKALLAGARGSHAASLRRLAVKAFRAVAKRYPSSGEVAAEASFRAGELLRAGGDEREALNEFLRAADTARGGSFVPRALLEAAHVERRAEHFDKALELYARTMSAREADAHARDLAALWSAKTRLEMGDLDEAERELRALVVRVRDPIDRLRSYDELILILARSGRIAAAVGHFAEAKRSVSFESREQTARGERVRNTLENMRALDVMRKAIAEAR